MIRAPWMPTEMNIGDSAIKRYITVGGDICLKDDYMVYVYTQIPDSDSYPGQKVEISFLNEQDEYVTSFELEGYLNPKSMMKEGILPLDVNLLSGIGPERLIEVTIAHYLAAMATLVFTYDTSTHEVRAEFECGAYSEVYRMPEEQVLKVFNKRI